MCGITEIFLCQLEFHHQWSFGHSAKQWLKRLSWLKIYRAVFYLHHYIAAEFSIKRYEFIISLLMPVTRRFIAVYKCTPHHYAIVRRYCISKHVGAIRVRAPIVLRARLPF